MYSRRTVLSTLSLAVGGVLGGGIRAGAFAESAAPEKLLVPKFTRQHGLVLVDHVITQQPMVAITFDDGPHPRNTPRLLDILRERKVRATFFLIGALVARYPDIARRMVDEGHEIGNHTWDHPMLWDLGNVSVLRQLDRTSEVIYQTVGFVPVTLRPPYGAITGTQCQMIHDTRNLPTVMWSVDPSDYRRPGSTVVASRIVTKSGNGAIILAHDIHGATVDAMPEAIDGLRTRGFKFVTMSALLGWGRWGKMRRVPVARPRDDQDD